MTSMTTMTAKARVEFIGPKLTECVEYASAARKVSRVETKENFLAAAFRAANAIASGPVQPHGLPVCTDCVDADLDLGLKFLHEASAAWAFAASVETEEIIEMHLCEVDEAICKFLVTAESGLISIMQAKMYGIETL